MSEHQRIAPCHCGSGQKYKRCHGVLPPKRTAYTEADRDSAMSRLVSFCKRREFEEKYENAMGLFGEPEIRELIENYPEPEVQALKDSKGLEVNQIIYFALDFELEPGRTMLDAFLERTGDGLRAAERRFLLDLRDAQLHYYRILELKAGEGLRLQRIWEEVEERIWVTNAELPSQYFLGDFMATRLLHSPSGEVEIWADLYTLPSDAEEAVCDALNDLWEEQRVSEPELTKTRFLKEHAHVVQVLWLQTLFGPRLSEMENGWEAECMDTSSSFALVDEPLFLKACATSPLLHTSHGFQERTGTHYFLFRQAEPSPDAPDGDFVAKVAIEGGRLDVLAGSKEKLLFAEEHFEKIAPECLGLRNQVSQTG